MGAEFMKKEELRIIGEYVKKNISHWMQESNIIPFSNNRREIDLAERIVRVEETLKHQGVLLEKSIESMEKRFVQVDKRFEDMRYDMNQRFTQIQWTMGLGFTILAALMAIFNFF